MKQNKIAFAGKKIVLMFLFSVVSLYAFEALDTKNFTQKVSDKNSIVKFYATWCSNCKVQAKNLAQLNQKELGVSIYEVNIEKEMELAQAYNIRVVPTTLYIKNGKVISTDLGVKSVGEIKNSIKQNF